MRELREGGGLAAALIEATAEVLNAVAQDQRISWSGVTSQGTDLLGWLDNPESAPDGSYLSSSFFSQPLIFATQMARYASSWELGLKKAFEAGSIVAVTGHSQGVMSATLVAESPNGKVSVERFRDYVEYFCWQGIHMARSNPPKAGEPGTCMAAVSKVRLSRLEEIVAKVNRFLPPQQAVTIALQNTRTRNVISGHPKPLSLVKEALERVAEKEKAGKKAGRFGGAPLTFTWEDLPVGAAFHTHHMEQGRLGMKDSLKELGFSLEEKALLLPVYLCDGETKPRG